MRKKLWSFLSIAPRGHRTVLVGLAWLRLVAFFAVAARLIAHTSSDFRLATMPLPDALLVALSMTYTATLVVLAHRKQALFLSTTSMVIQVILDISIVWLAQYYVEDLKSDIYYLNLIPIVIGVEFFPVAWVLLILAVIVGGHLLLLASVASIWTPSVWIRDFLPRNYVFLIISIVYFAQRQMRTDIEQALEEEREKIMTEFAQFLQRLSIKDRKFESWLRERLTAYVDKAELYRRMMAHRFFEQKSEPNYLGMLQAIEESLAGSSLGHDETYYLRLAQNAMEEIAESLHCVTGAYCVLAPAYDQKQVLCLQFAWGTGAKQIREEYPCIHETKANLAWKAYRTRQVQAWVKSKTSVASRLFDNQSFITKHSIGAAVCAPFTFLGSRGVVSLYRNEPTEFSANERAAIQTFLEAVAAVIEKSRLSATLSKWQSAMQATASELAHLKSEKEILDYVAKQVQETFQAETVAVFLLRGQHLKRKAAAGIPQDWFPDETYHSGNGLTWKAFASTESFTLENNAPANNAIVEGHRRQYETQLATRQVQHLLVVPIRTSANSIGVIRLVNKLDAPRDLSQTGFSEAEAQAVLSLAAILALSLDVSTQMKRFKTLRQLVQTTAGLQEEEDVAHAVCRMACQAVNGDQARVILFGDDKSSGTVVGQVVKTHTSDKQGYEASYLEKQRLVDMTHYAASIRVASDRRATAILDAKSDPLTESEHAAFERVGIMSIMLAPLLVADEVIGLLEVGSLHERRQFLPEELDLCELIAAYGGRAIEQSSRFGRARSDGQKMERARLRSDVHDIRALIGGTMIVRLQLMQDILEKGQPEILRKMLSETLIAATSINDSIIYVMDDLQDPTLAEEGVPAAIDNFIQRYWPAKPIQFHSNLRERLNRNVEGQVYRIAQEAISNACEHGIEKLSGCQVEVNLTFDDYARRVTLCVTDDGGGFNVTDLERTPTLGIYMMKERARRLGTELEIQSALGQGTTVRVVIPLSLKLDAEDDDV
jgi:GAF domain-containing protein